MSKNASSRSGRPPGIEIKSVGIRWFHPAGFLVDRPRGSGDFAYMQWLTPCRMRVNGVEATEKPGGCIVFRPDDPQWFGSDAYNPFGNTWFHFHGADAARLLDDCGIPLNQAIRLRDDSFVEPLLNLFTREIMSRPRHWRLMAASAAMRFFVEAARSMAGISVRIKSPRSAELKEVFDGLREKLRDRCVEPWTLREMAAQAYLSTSRFSSLYREFYGVNPIDDLIRMRLAKAEYYLCMTNLPVGNIAELCGFSSAYYFNRQFKGKIGETPGHYRLLHGGSPEAEEPWSGDAAP
ncbi:MAG: AraC family transcriptional regulator [Planctomycetota bacterium]|jgi:AraC family transcriptional regulator of arabinose operon|nr:AraC family transcriptional regulator [Planctomycetota bacterium]